MEETIKCQRCGKVVQRRSGAQKYCPDCAPVAYEAARVALHKDPKGVKVGETMICEMCGKETVRKTGNQRYCPDCSPNAGRKKRRRAGRPPGRPRKDSEEKRLLNWHDLSGKSLARVDAEAKAFGLSYGQYTAAVRAGSIDQVLLHKGIVNPRKILKEIKVK